MFGAAKCVGCREARQPDSRYSRANERKAARGRMGPLDKALTIRVALHAPDAPGGLNSIHARCGSIVLKKSPKRNCGIRI